MSWLDEQLSARFIEWERHGRGWDVWQEPVFPEPLFKPFPGHVISESSSADDGRRPTILSSLMNRLSETLSTQSPTPHPADGEEEALEPEILERGTLAELQVSLPPKLNASPEVFAQFLSVLTRCREPIVFEVIGQADAILTQFAAHPSDMVSLKRQLLAHFPEGVFVQKEDVLATSWRALDGTETAVVECGLAREFIFPLATDGADSLVALSAALSELQPHELGLFQVIFQPLRHAWANSVLRAVSDPTGKPAFVNAPELLAHGQRKASQPLFAAVVRIAARSEELGRAWEIARDMAAALSVFADIEGNELIPLSNDDYPFEDHVEDVWRRQSRRSGMILNQDELVGFVHLPTTAVRTPKFQREIQKTKRAPKFVESTHGVLLGHNEHAGQTVPVRLTPEQRVRHTHVIGASGTGKSTLLFNLIRQDIENGEGVAVLDPHGDLVEKILGIIPPERIGDVVLVDPSDEQYSVGFNILSAHSDLEKNLLASDLVSVFQRLSTSWGDQMGSVLQNAILAFLESSQRGTLADLRRFLIEPAFRTQFLKTVQDPNVVYYWQKGFPQLSGNKSIGPVLTRLENFLSPKPIRYMVSQPENRLDFAQIMDTGKIFLAKLPEGLLGKENSYLLGTLLVSKFQQLAMSRQAQRKDIRKDFWLYIDEFHNFITPSMAEILQGARKYRVGLTLAHHELHQLQRNAEVASAVMSHPFTRLVFRVGDDDARKLAEGFSFFEASDLKNLETGHAVVRMERSDFDFNLAVPQPEEPNESEASKRREEVITASREKYATPRARVEAVLLKLWEVETQTVLKPSVPEKVLPKPLSSIPAVSPAPPLPIPSPVMPKLSTLSERKAPPDLGKGGAQHQAIQRRIKEAAEKLGFRSTIEKPVLEGLGHVDLSLERSDQTIACEISVTTTVDHEIGNIKKCLKAGFTKIAVICVDEERLTRIAAAVFGSLGSETAAKVGHYLPDQFIAYLESLPPPVSEAPKKVETRRGYKIKRSALTLTPEEQKQREDAAIRSIAEAMKAKIK